MSQGQLFPDPQAIKTKVIARRKDFEALFAGFERLRGVSYVVSPDLILELYDRHGLRDIEMVVGQNLTESYRQELTKKAPLAEKLAARVAQGNLRIFVPEKTLHTKLYILERPDQVRIIQTSANLTETAREASRQVNYAWYADLPPGHPWLDLIEGDYREHRGQCTLFMDDLAKLLGQAREEDRRQIVERWLQAGPVEEVAAETRRQVAEISRQAVEAATGAEPFFSVQLPEAPAARRDLERFLAPVPSSGAGERRRLNAGDYLRYVQESHGVPLLLVNLAERTVRLAMDGEVAVLNEPLPSAEAVGAALRHLEEYIATVDLGQAPDPRFAKTSLWEGLLYMLSAPFSHEVMRIRRRLYGAIESRGPSFLYVYGSSQNGKSTFLRLALKLITGRLIEPQTGSDFAKRKIQGTAAINTAFPLVFDDLAPNQRPGLFEEILKSYWEQWWVEGAAVPQIVLSSNAYTLKDWAKSRVKRLDFDVQFAPSPASKETLSRLFRADNRVFRWFAPLYLERLSSAVHLPEDELEFARRVLEDLYRHAGKAPPPEFPSQPIEKLYNPGRRDWLEIVERTRKARVSYERDRATVTFSDDMLPYEIKRYENALPQAVKHRRQGRTLVIESPGEFRSWLEGSPKTALPLWRRLLGH